MNHWCEQAAFRVIVIIGIVIGTQYTKQERGRTRNKNVSRNQALVSFNPWKQAKINRTYLELKVGDNARF